MCIAWRLPATLFSSMFVFKTCNSIYIMVKPCRVSSFGFVLVSSLPSIAYVIGNLLLNNQCKTSCPLVQNDEYSRQRAPITIWHRSWPPRRFSWSKI